MSDIELFDILAHDMWDSLPEELRGGVPRPPYGFERMGGLPTPGIGRQALGTTSSGSHRRTGLPGPRVARGPAVASGRGRVQSPRLDPRRSSPSSPLSPSPPADGFRSPAGGRRTHPVCASRPPDRAGAAPPSRVQQQHPARRCHGDAPARGGLRPIVSAERPAPAALLGDRAFRSAGPDAPRRDRERQHGPATHARVLGDRQHRHGPALRDGQSEHPGRCPAVGSGGGAG